MTDADDKAKLAAIARNLETVLQEMVAMREETRALTESLTRVAEKMEAIVAQFERTPDVLPDDPSGHA